MRSFTGDTIPISVYVGEKVLKMQELLLDIFQLMKVVIPVEPQQVCQLLETKKTLLGMSCEPDSIIKEASVQGLGHFTAYANGSVKVQFTDRTILRL